MSIGRRIFEERVRLGLSEAQFGELCGHKADAVLKWEKGSDHPDAPALAKWAEKKVDVYFILTGNTGPLNKEESDLIESCRRCPESARQRVYAAAKDGEQEEIVLDLLNAFPKDS